VSGKKVPLLIEILVTPKIQLKGVLFSGHPVYKILCVDQQLSFFVCRCGTHEPISNVFPLSKNTPGWFSLLSLTGLFCKFL